MPRNDSSGKMSSEGGVSSDRIQPGRVLLVLRDGTVHDDLIYQIATQCGEVKNMHRPSNNRMLVFVQYEEPSSAEKAINVLKKLPIFKSVDSAIKSDRFANDRSSGNFSKNNNNNNEDRQQKNMVYSQQKGGNQSSNACTPLMDLRFNHNPALHAMNFDLEPPSLNPELVRLLDMVVPPEYRQLVNNPQHHTKQQHRIGTGNQQKQPRNDSKPNNNKSVSNGYDDGGSCHGGRNDDFNDAAESSMDFGSPQMFSKKADPCETKFVLGCWSCNKLPNFECRCGAFYCDIECQRADWPMHKGICMPRLVPMSYSNKCILQEARAAKQSSVQTNTPEMVDSKAQSQQNQNNRRAPANIKNNKFSQNTDSQPPKQNKPTKGSNQKKIQSNSPPSDQSTPNSSPAEAPPAKAKVGAITNKLQRLKISRSVVGSSEGVLSPGVFPREGSMVKITASLPTGILYIYRNNNKEGNQHSDYYQLTTRMFQAASTAKPLPKKPSVGDVIFAPFLDGHFRAKVVSENGDNLDVFFVDFGNSDTVDWQQSKEIADPDLKWAKYLTFPVVLEGVETFTKEMIELLETLEHEEEFELVKAEPAGTFISVVLKRPRKTLTLNMELIELKERELRQKREREEQKERERLEKERKEQEEQETLMKEQARKEVEVKVAHPSNYLPVLFDESMETKELSPGEETLLIIDASEVHLSSIVSVVALDDMERYATILESCNSAGAEDSNVYQPTEDGEVCLVLYDNDWSRALWDASEGSFMLLDVGVITKIAPSNVRRFPPGLGKVVYNNEVIVKNLAMLKEMMKDNKPSSVHGKLIKATISVSEDVLAITIVKSL